MNKPQILIVEDESVAAAELAVTLNELGYSVYAVDSSERIILGTLKEMQPDLILMDIKLKGTLDGITLTAEINKNYDIPVVYITGISDENTWKRAMKTQNYGFLLKPFTETELHAVIERTLQRFDEREKTS